MQTFNSNGVKIAYQEAGAGDPVVLVHGFASTGDINWASTGWVRVLAEAGKRVIYLDNRGHGASEKLYDPAQYEATEMAEDVRRLLDHLDIRKADIMGYSMGARITAFMLINHPVRLQRAVIAGMAGNIFKGVETSDIIADGLEAENAELITYPAARAFRLFAERTGGDLWALAACMRAGRPPVRREELAEIEAPVLVVAGSDDDISGPVAPLVDAIPGAEGLTLEGRDHMKAVGDRTFQNRVLSFLTQ